MDCTFGGSVLFSLVFRCDGNNGGTFGALFRGVDLSFSSSFLFVVAFFLAARVNLTLSEKVFTGSKINNLLPTIFTFRFALL